MTITDSDLAGRVRAALVTESPLQEVPMFGGLSFMVNERLMVSVGADATLLVRIDPARSEQLLRERCEARLAEMGGRTMGPAWLRIDAEAIAGDEFLNFWIAEARAFNTKA